MNLELTHKIYLLSRTMWIFAVLCFFTPQLQLQAQVNAPELLCIQNDTLRWNVPANSCGTFNAYLIYSSQSAAGPFNVLASIADQNQSTYHHDDAGNQTWYYYMESDLDCPGQPVLQSDTLDNRIPDAGPIRLVTVEDATTTRVEWMPSSSPEVTGYIVSRQNELGTTILDTIYSGLSYTDMTARPEELAETYFVVALDPCGNASLVPDPHRTILLEILSVDSCSQEVNLAWSEYINWPGGVERYDILVSEADAQGIPGPYATVGAVEGTVTQFTFPATNDGSTFCFKIQAVAAGSGDISTSNETCVEVGAVQAVRDLILTNLEVDPQSVTVNWILEPDVPLAAATLFRSENGTDFSPVADITTAVASYADMTALASVGPLTYRIEAEDLCGNTISSNQSSTIYLSGENGKGRRNVLRWTPYNNEAGRLSNYDLYRIMGTRETLLATHGQTEQSHTDLITLGDPEQAILCYYVVANAEIILSDQSLSVQSVSNLVCLEQSAKLFVPNAFVPDGVNREFKPVLQFGGSEEYLMTIFDRFGGIVFESQDIATGWDGRKNGQPLPQGVYVYLIKMRQSSGQMIEKKGTVMLLR